MRSYDFQQIFFFARCFRHSDLPYPAANMFMAPNIADASSSGLSHSMLAMSGLVMSCNVKVHAASLRGKPWDGEGQI